MESDDELQAPDDGVWLIWRPSWRRTTTQAEADIIAWQASPNL